MTKGRLLFFTLLLVLSVLLAFIYYNNFHYHTVAAQDLAHAYSKDTTSADQEFLNKRLNVTGQVKSHYTLMDSKPVLQLQTYHGDLPLICFFLNDEDRYISSQLKEDQIVSVKGKCLGTGAYNLVKGVKIEVESITPQ